MSASVIAVVVYGLIRWIFFLANWSPVVENLRLYAVGPYPQEQMWRIWTIVYMVSFLTGVSAGKWRGTVLTFARRDGHRLPRFSRPAHQFGISGDGHPAASGGQWGGHRIRLCSRSVAAPERHLACAGVGSVLCANIDLAWRTAQCCGAAVRRNRPVGRVTPDLFIGAGRYRGLLSDRRVARTGQAKFSAGRQGPMYRVHRGGARRAVGDHPVHDLHSLAAASAGHEWYRSRPSPRCWA